MGPCTSIKPILDRSLFWDHTRYSSCSSRYKAVDAHFWFSFINCNVKAMKLFLITFLLSGLALGVTHNPSHCTDGELRNGTVTTRENLATITPQPTTAASQLEATVQIQVGDFAASIIVELTALNPTNTSASYNTSTTMLPLSLNTTTGGNVSKLNNTAIPTPTTSSPRFANETTRTNITGRSSGSFIFPPSAFPSTLFTSGSTVSGDISTHMAHVFVVMNLFFMFV